MIVRSLCDISPRFIGPKFYSVKVSSHIVGNIAIKVYSPEDKTKKPVVVYYHGGGWVIGIFKAYDRIFRYISYNADCIVVAIEYRKAPEYKFPTALQDSYLGYCWTVNNISELNGDTNRLVLCGDSAGGNLILGLLSMIYRQKIIPTPYLLVLIYPLLEPTINSSNKRTWLGKVSNKILNYSLKQYLAEYSNHNIRQISFISNFNEKIPYPTTFIFTGELDALTADINLYANKLRAKGTEVFIKEYPGALHGAINFSGLFKVSKTMLKDITEHIQCYCK